MEKTQNSTLKERSLWIKINLDIIFLSLDLDLDLFFWV